MITPDSQTGQLSPDGRWRWDGTRWVPAVPAQTPAAAAPPPASPASSPAPRPAGLAYQFSGNALWSIVFGVASVVVPILTPVYFPILPIFGLWRGVLAIRTGRVAGGVVGVMANVLGCVVSLLASGVLFR